MQLLESLTAWDACACGALIATVISLWLQPRRLWVALLAFTLVCGYVADILFGPAALWLLALGVGLLVYRHSRARSARVLSILLILSLGLLLGMHALTGFRNPLLARDVVLSLGAAPYSLYFNFDKTFVGVLLLGLGASLPSSSSVVPALRIAAPIIAVNVCIGIVLSLSLGYVTFAPKWTEFFWSWALVNLLLTCLSEEAFFRGFIQRELHLALGRTRHGSTVAVGASALLFGLAHFAGGWRYVLLASVAGVGYALVYQRTQRIELSILAHFALNATHFLFFSYPYLA